MTSPHDALFEIHKQLLQLRDDQVGRQHVEVAINWPTVVFAATEGATRVPVHMLEVAHGNMLVASGKAILKRLEEAQEASNWFPAPANPPEAHHDGCLCDRCAAKPRA